MNRLHDPKLCGSCGKQKVMARIVAEAINVIMTLINRSAIWQLYVLKDMWKCEQQQELFCTPCMFPSETVVQMP